MSWHDYVERSQVQSQLLSDNSIFMDGQRHGKLPAIIRQSIRMISDQWECGNYYNAMVFQESSVTTFLFSLFKQIHNLDADSGALKDNDPHHFKYGEKLKFGKSVVKFFGTEKNNIGIEYISFGDDDANNRWKYKFLMDKAPIFQKADAGSKVSKSDAFDKEWKSKNCEYHSNDLIDQLASHRSYYSNSILIVGSKNIIINQFRTTSIDEHPLTDLFIVSHAKYDGNIENCFSGKLSGTPAFIIASDCLSAKAAIKKNPQISEIIINADDARIDNRLNEFDELKEQNKAITCIVSKAKGIDLHNYKDRGFSIWRWNKDNEKYFCNKQSNLIPDDKLETELNESIEYKKLDCSEIGESFDKLKQCVEDEDDLPLDILYVIKNTRMEMYDLIQGITSISEESREDKINGLYDLLDRIDNCEDSISEERKDKLREILKGFISVYCAKRNFPKVKAIKEYLQKHRCGSVCFIIYKNSSIDKEETLAYWESFIKSADFQCKISVMYPDEYLIETGTQNTAVIPAGWFGRNKMKSILFSYNSNEYFIPLYSCENRWKEQLIRYCDYQIGSIPNDEFMAPIYDLYAIEPEKKQEKIIAPKVIDEVDEQTTVGTRIVESGFRKYRSAEKEESELAYPVAFAGENIAFFTDTHKLITATGIINATKDEMDEVFPNQLENGDFIVMRESSSDLIDDLAGQILEKEGNKGDIETAETWHDGVEIFKSGRDADELVRNIQRRGCKRNIQTIRRWVTDNSVIKPNRIEDLTIIAQAAGDEITLANIDDIWAAGERVISAHIKAGHQLSEKLKNELNSEMSEVASIDPDNIWDPINLYIEGIGNVMVLKVIDIYSEKMMVNRGDLNRLMKREES